MKASCTMRVNEHEIDTLYKALKINYAATEQRLESKLKRAAFACEHSRRKVIKSSNKST